MLKIKSASNLVKAIFLGDYQESARLIDSLTVNQQDSRKQTPLHAAAFCGEVQIAELLMNRGARINAMDENWLTPLHRACASNSIEIVRMLLNRGADVSARDKSWQTPLHIAASNGSVECVSMLLQDFEETVNVSDHAGRSPLHYAAFAGHFDVVKLLLENSASVSMVDSKDRSALHWAAAGGYTEIVQLLHEYGAYLDCTDKCLYTPLHVAAALGFSSVVQCLISLNAQLDLATIRGNTPLHLACLNSQDQVVKLLLEAIYQKSIECSASSSTSDLTSTEVSSSHSASGFKAVLAAVNRPNSVDSFTPVHLAAAARGLVLLRILQSTTPPSSDDEPQNVERRSMADLDCCGGVDNCTPLHLAALNGNVEAGKLLLKHGANMTAQDRHGYTALHIAADRGYEQFIHMLLEHGCPWNIRDHNKVTALHCTVLAGFRHCLSKLKKVALGETLKSPLDWDSDEDSDDKTNWDCNPSDVQPAPDLMNDADRNGRTLVHAAALVGNPYCLMDILMAGGDPFRLDFSGRSALHYAVGALAFASGGPLDPRAQGPLCTADKMNFFNLTCTIKDIIQSVVIFLKLGLDPNLVDNYGCTPLHLACMYDNSGQIVETLIQYGANPLTTVKWPPRLGMTTKSGIRPVDLLLDTTQIPNDTNLTIDIQEAQLLSPPCTRSQHRPSSSVIRSDRSECSVANTHQSGDQRFEQFIYSPIHFVTKMGHLAALKVLLKHVSEPVRRDYIFGNLVTDQIKQDLSSDPQKAEQEHGNLNHESPVLPAASPLLLAALQPDGEMLTLLLNYYLSNMPIEPTKPDSECEEIPNQSLEEITNLKGYVSVCQLYSAPILSFAYPADSRDTFCRWNVLHHAASQGHHEIVPVLIELFSKQNLLKNQESISSSEVKSLNQFLNSVDEHERTPLMLAAQNNHSSIIELLIVEYEAIPSISSTKSTTTPSTVKKSNYRGREALYDAADIYGRTALHRAAANGHYDCLTRLFQLGASLTIRDFRERQALHFAATNGNTNILSFILDELSRFYQHHEDQLNLFHPLDEYGFSPLHFAAYKGHIGCLQLLLETGHYQNPRGNAYTPLHCAVQHGYDDCVKRLLDHFPPSYLRSRDSSGRTVVHIAALCDQLNSLNTITSIFDLNINRNQFDPMYDGHLSEQSEAEIGLADLLTQRDQLGRTALMLAAQSGSDKMISKLIDLHMECVQNLNRILGNEFCQKQCSDCRLVRLIKQLLDDLRWDVRDQDGLNVMHYACLASDDRAFKSLVASGEDLYPLIMSKDRIHRTPLHLAITSGLHSVVESLIDHGADLYATDLEGRIPVLSSAPSIQVANCVSLCLAKMFPPLTEEDQKGSRHPFHVAISSQSHGLSDQTSESDQPESPQPGDEQSKLQGAMMMSCSLHVASHPSQANDNNQGNTSDNQIDESQTRNSNRPLSFPGSDSDFF